MGTPIRRAAAAAFAVASLIAMLVVVVTGEHTTFELVLEVATWTAATIAIAVVIWR